MGRSIIQNAIGYECSDTINISLELHSTGHERSINQIDLKNGVNVLCLGYRMFTVYVSYCVSIYSVIVELRDMKLQEKKLKEKCKQEDGIVSAVSLWASEILPNWETM